MALVMNTDIESQTVQAFGNWFTFKAGQVKGMDPKLADFLSQEKRSQGFVRLPDICEEEPDSDAAKEAKEVKITEGRQNIISHLEALRHNLEVSLQRDYDIAGMKTSAIHVEGKAHLGVYRKLRAFKDLRVTDQDAVAKEINELKGAIDGSTVVTDANNTPKRD